MPDQTPAVGMERKLAAIFSTDVAGYSRLMGDDEEATIRTLTTYRAVISSLIQHHRGRVADAPGDNLLAEFASVVDAVRCARPPFLKGAFFGSPLCKRGVRGDFQC